MKMGKRQNRPYANAIAKPKKRVKLGISGRRHVGKMGNMDGKAQTLPDHPIQPARDLEAPTETKPVCGAKAWMECRRS